MKNYQLLSLCVILVLLCSCDQRSGAELYLYEHEQASRAPLTQPRTFLDFKLGDTRESIEAHAIKLEQRGKLQLSQYQGEPAAIYEFVLPDGNSVNYVKARLTFGFTEERLNSLNINFLKKNSESLQLQIVNVYENKLGPAKFYTNQDDIQCYYWIKEGQEIFLRMPKNTEPEVTYEALALTQEAIDSEMADLKKSNAEVQIADSIATAETTNDL